MAARGATALFVPINNGLPPAKACSELVAQARKVNIARAVENSMWVIRADVAGHTDELVSCGASGIVDPDGMVVHSARELCDDLIVAEIDTLAAHTAPRIGPVKERPLTGECARLRAADRDS